MTGRVARSSSKLRKFLGKSYWPDGQVRRKVVSQNQGYAIGDGGTPWLELAVTTEQRSGQLPHTEIFHILIHL